MIYTTQGRRSTRHALAAAPAGASRSRGSRRGNRELVASGLVHRVSAASKLVRDARLPVTSRGSAG